MDNEKGKINSPIWLIGDSPPEAWVNDLKHPFDERHPAIHNIWTPIMYKMQKKVFKEKSMLINDDKDDLFYFRNAVTDDSIKPDPSALQWDNAELNKQLNEMQNRIKKNDPKLVITFGAFAYEFIRRCFNLGQKEQKHWGAKKLGKEFRSAVKDNSRIIPLLHISISNGNWVSSHKRFTGDENGNYFIFTSERLYKRLIEIIPATHYLYTA